MSSCATQYHAFFRTKTIQLVQLRREDRLKKSVRPTINKATSAKGKSSKKRLVYSKSMPTITFKLNYFLIKLFLN